MASRFETIPEHFLNHLGESIPGFKSETAQHQHALAHMAWMGINNANRHSHMEGAMTFFHLDLDAIFGRSEFKEISRRLDFFKWSPGWSRDNKFTRGYYFSEQVRLSIAKYLAGAPWASTTRLVMADGKALRALPPAVASKDKSGVTTSAWSSATKLSRVKVNVEELMKLKAELERDSAIARLDDPTATAVSNPGLGMADRAIDMIGKISRMAMTDVAGESHVAHSYEEAQSGRLYPLGISLASAQSVVKDAALTGNWEYDIANCHYAILAQMAAKAGFECPVISGYLLNKEETRRAIASEARITPRQAKTCLVALMYGARTSTWRENAIPGEIGVDAAKRLYKSPIFIGIDKEIRKARGIILSKCAKTPKGWIKNAFGKSVPGTVKQAPKMAHLLQGVEAKALQAVINLHPNDIILAQHDGFVSSRRLDVASLSAAIETATGYHLVLEEKCLKADAYKYFKSRMGSVHSKT